MKQTNHFGEVKKMVINSILPKPIADAQIGESFIIKLAEISAIDYPDFNSMLKDDLQAYIDKWNAIYINNPIQPTGTLKQDLLNAILEKVGTNE